MENQRKPVDLSLLEQLADSMAPVHDPQLGDGARTKVGDASSKRAVEVTVFPDTHVARIQTRLHSTTIRRAEGEYDQENHSLSIVGANEDEFVSATIHSNGAVFVVSSPHDRAPDEPVVSPPASEEHEKETVTPPPPEASKGSHDGSEKAQNTIEQERLTLIGRVGTEPRFRTTKNDKLVCSFPLAVHQDDGSTKWHDVVTFGERAVKLQDSLHKGQEVQIVGYVHTKEVKGKDGAAKEKREVWAAVVRKPESESNRS